MKKLWNKFWYNYWNNKLTKFLERNSHIPFYYLQYTTQFKRIYNKKENYKAQYLGIVNK